MRSAPAPNRGQRGQGQQPHGGERHGPRQRRDRARVHQAHGCRRAVVHAHRPVPRRRGLPNRWHNRLGEGLAAVAGLRSQHLYGRTHLVQRGGAVGNI